MGKQLIAARNDLESRFNDMDLMIRILELDENKKIEKSASFEIIVTFDGVQCD